IVIDQGLNVQQYVREFIGRIRDLLMLKFGLEEKILGSPEDKRALAERAESFSEQDLIRFFDLLLRIESELRWTSQSRFHLEIGFIKLAKIGYVRDIEGVIRDLKGGNQESPSVATPRRVPATAPKIVQTKPLESSREPDPEIHAQPRASNSDPENFAENF